MNRLRRFFRRKQKKLYVVLSLLSLFNFVFPQPVQAKPTSVVRTARVADAVAVQPAIAQKAKGAVLPTPPPAPARRVVRVVATAYTSSYDETDSDPNTTASGAKTTDGVIAVNGIPFGTKVRIPEYYGDKVFTVLDRMGARHGSSRIDIWMTTKHDAREWGVRNVKMEII